MRYKPDRLVPVLAMSFPALVLLFLAGFYRSAWELGPLAGGYPRFLMMSLFAILMLVLATEFRDMYKLRRERAGAREASGAQAEVKKTTLESALFEEGIDWIRTLIVIALTALLAVTLSHIGLYVGVAAFLIIALPLLKVRRPLPILFTVAATLVTIWGLFENLLSLSVPHWSLF